MTTTRAIYRGAHYDADALADGSLCVTRKRKRGGILITASDATAAWVNAIETAIDTREAHDLCRALLSE